MHGILKIYLSLVCYLILLAFVGFAGTRVCQTGSSLQKVEVSKTIASFSTDIDLALEEDSETELHTYFMTVPPAAFGPLNIPTFFSILHGEMEESINIVLKNFHFS